MNSEIVQKAFDAHASKESDKSKVIQLYQEALEKHPDDKRLYINLGALLRGQGRPEESVQILQQGLITTKKESPAILNNLGNSLRDLTRYSEAASMYIRALKSNIRFLDADTSLYTCYQEMGHFALAKIQLSMMKFKYKDNPKQIQLMMVNHEIRESTRLHRDLNPQVESLLEELDLISDDGSEEKYAPIHWFSTAINCASKGKLKEAIQFHEKGTIALRKFACSENRSSSIGDIHSMYYINSWNLSCTLLREGDFTNGWKLYDHGLCTPADSAQRWQRSLFKPASSSTINIWKGESLFGKSILLLGEQGIGDSMQFLLCARNIIKRANKVTLILPDRIKPIYERSLPECMVYGQEDIRKKKIDFKAQDYDYQSPLGSILQYEISTPNQIGCKGSFLVPRSTVVSEMHKKYSNGKPLVGLSWQGGGTGSRLKEKSIPLELFFNVFNNLNVRYLSLQYGDDEKMVNSIANKKKIDFIDDPKVQAMQNMELWLDQVACCDFVISVANTTIHGSGGLGKPTFCLLGKKPDWRWLKNPKISYWYPTVKVAQFNEKDEWKAALLQAKQWLEAKIQLC